MEEHLRKKILKIEDSLDEAYELVGFGYVKTEEKYSIIVESLFEIDMRLNEIKKVFKGKDNID